MVFDLLDLLQEVDSFRAFQAESALEHRSISCLWLLWFSGVVQRTSPTLLVFCFFIPYHKRGKSNAGKWSANMIWAAFIVRVEKAGLTIFSMLAAVGLTFRLKWLCRLTISSWTVPFVPGQSAAQTHTEKKHADMYTHTHLKPMCKQQIKDIMKSDVYSGGFIATIWLTKHILV